MIKMDISKIVNKIDRYNRVHKYKADAIMNSTSLNKVEVVD